MKNLSIRKAIVMLPMTLLIGCGSEEVSFSTQEDSRRQAIENAEYNARNWRDSNSPELKILMRGDSTISASCAQGDGWATVDLENEKESLGQKIQFKCSTVSGTIGCLKKEGFQERSYAKQEGRCNTDLPMPLPKITK